MFVYIDLTSLKLDGFLQNFNWTKLHSAWLLICNITSSNVEKKQFLLKSCTIIPLLREKQRSSHFNLNQ